MSATDKAFSNYMGREGDGPDLPCPGLEEDWRGGG